jgi:hypothetical protein
MHPLELLRQHYGDEPPRGGGYSQLANVGEVVVTRELLPGVTVRRATPAETDEIRLAIHSYTDIERQLRSPHETKFKKEPWPGGPPNSWQETWTPLPPEDWRYVGLEHPGSSAITHWLAQASVLTPKHLEIGVEVGLHPLSVGAGMVGRFIAEAQHDDGLFLRLDDGDLVELADVHERFQKHDDAVVPLRAVVSDYQDLRGVPRDSRLRFLGYCSLLESLLAHLPNKDDPTESLTRQVRQKMILLEQRFRHPLSFTDFGTTPHEKVWTKLYHLRSWIAHGTPPDFGKEFQVLGDLAKATRFIAGATWRVMRQALDEPQLVADLRNC